MTKSKISTLFTLLLLVFCTGCQSLEQISIDYLQPAVLSFPSQIRKIAIVDNTTDTLTEKLTYKGGKADKKTYVLERATAHSPADGKIMCEALAKEIAQHNYFDVVVICDSALQVKGTSHPSPTLSPEEVRQLSADLNVDLLVTVENTPLHITKTIRYMPEYNCCQAAVDVKISPTLKVYIPERSKPIHTIHSTDSIFWNEFGGTPEEAFIFLIPDAEMLKESSDFAGMFCAKYLVPTWTKNIRHLYVNNSVPMRDAGIYARENNWEEAYPLWKQVFEASKSKKKKMKAAFNIAVYFEMKDDLSKAQEWAQKAVELAKEVDKKNKANLQQATIDEVPHYYQAYHYWKLLKERNEQFPKLKMQMNRFNDDF